MKYNRTYNFSAGPAMMPEPVLEEICELSARVIVNQVSMQMESERIREIILRLRKQLEEA